MIKFYKAKNTEIRKVAEVDESGNIKEVKAIIGRVADLLEQEILFPDNTAGNEGKWLLINQNGACDIEEFASLADAKQRSKEKWEQDLEKDLGLE